MVERELQCALMERSYYENLVSRGVEAHHSKEALEGLKPLPAKVVQLRKSKRKRPGQDKFTGTPNRSTEQYVYEPRSPHPQHRGRSDYDELLECSFEIDELD